MKKEEKTTNKKVSGLAKAARIIALIVFSVMMACLLATTVSDIVIFSKQFFNLAIAILVAAFLFIVLTIIYLVTYMLVFGFFLISFGFWPFSITEDVFLDIVFTDKINYSQVASLITIRWIVLVFLMHCIAGAIVALALNKASKVKGNEGNTTPTKSLAVTVLVFSALGLCVGIFVLLVAPLLI